MANPSTSTDYFALFGLDPQFNVDLSLLSQRYRDIQHQTHPDRHAGKSDQQQRMAVQYAAFVNQAFQCLKHPLERAKYLLRLKGVDTSAESHSHFDNAFLMEQMELREQLERVAGQANPEQGFENLMQRVVAKTAAIEKQFEQQFDAGQFEQAKDTVSKWQFLIKLQRDAASLEEDLFP